MDKVTVTLVVVGMWALKSAATLALVYIGARLAIRHERRVA